VAQIRFGSALDSINFGWAQNSIKRSALAKKKLAWAQPERVTLGQNQYNTVMGQKKVSKQEMT
jgi:hypothetical protein